MMTTHEGGFTQDTGYFDLGNNGGVTTERLRTRFDTLSVAVDAVLATRLAFTVRSLCILVLHLRKTKTQKDVFHLYAFLGGLQA